MPSAKDPNLEMMPFFSPKIKVLGLNSDKGSPPTPTFLLRGGSFAKTQAAAFFL